MNIFRRRKSYGVTPERDEWVAPEETLVDAGSSLSAIEVPVSDSIFRGAYGVGLLLCLICLGAVARLAIQRHDFFLQLSYRNKTVNVTVPPPRGIILDRTGTPLVVNVPSFDVLVISREVHLDEQGMIQGLAGLSAVLGRSTEELAMEIEDGMRRNAVFFVATDVARSQVLALKPILPPGFSLIITTKRQYEHAEVFSQILGYIGKVSKADIARDAYYTSSDTVGRLGIESQYERELRGTHGQLSFDASEAITTTPAVSGSNLVLSIDDEAQQSLYGALSDILRESGLSQAAGIVQDPRDGSVIAMVSFPTYDNNIFNSSPLSQAQYETLFDSRTRPLFNRVISGRYNPGSTIKPYIGMTALQERIVSADQVVSQDCVSISVPNPQHPDDPYVFKNWRSDTGPFNLYRAIADSCNVYFYTVGGGYGSLYGLGIERIAKYLHLGFADRELGIDLPGEVAGFLPTPDWKYTTQKEPWYQGDTYNTSIGQGDLVVTPLWINAYVSAIANGGTIWKPKLALRTVDDTIKTKEVFEATPLGQLPFSAGVIRAMQDAMEQTVTSGTAKMLGNLPVSVAAKTGTAEVVKGQRINSLLTLYAPADNPEIALTILVEGSASNQGYALRAAYMFLKWYFDEARKSGVSPTVIPSP